MVKEEEIKCLHKHQQEIFKFQDHFIAVPLNEYYDWDMHPMLDVLIKESLNKNPSSNIIERIYSLIDSFNNEVYHRDFFNRFAS